MSKVAQKNGPWISALAASKRLGKSIYVVMKLAAQGLVTTRTEPGMATKYSTEDIDRIAKEYTASN
jgi:hypothetical protein